MALTQDEIQPVFVILNAVKNPLAAGKFHLTPLILESFI